jgi:hypothetical protein
MWHDIPSYLRVQLYKKENCSVRWNGRKWKRVAVNIFGSFNFLWCITPIRNLRFFIGNHPGDTLQYQKRSRTAGCYYILLLVPRWVSFPSVASTWFLIHSDFFVRYGFFSLVDHWMLFCVYFCEKKNIEPLRMQHRTAIKLFSFLFTFKKENVQNTQQRILASGNPFCVCILPQTKHVSWRDGTYPETGIHGKFHPIQNFRTKQNSGARKLPDTHRVGEIQYIFLVNAHHSE